MILLLTGQPGHGKTAYGLVRAFELKKQGREVYAHGIKNLDYERAGFHQLDDPTKWQELPDGAVVLLDECYDTFPNRNPGAKVPEHVEAMARHRHRGFDFILIAQQGLQLDPFLRGLYEEHIHVRKKFGKVTKLLRWSQYQSNVKAKCADASDWVRPQWVFDYYTSTVKDTSRLHVPKWIKVTAALFAIVVLGMWMLAGMWGADAQAGSGPSILPANLPGAPVTGGGTTTGAGEPGQPKWETPTDYAQAHLPRFDTMPWTAPVYDDRRVTADPQLICMSSAPGQDSNGDQLPGSCTCLTEQGTFYEISEPQCRRIARFGPVYNPYKEKDPSRPVLPAAQPDVIAPPASAVLSAPQITGYGELGITPNPGGGA